MTITENSLDNTRFEWVAETTEGVTPTDPEWNRFSDYVQSAPGWDGEIATTQNNALGSNENVTITRGAESPTLTAEYFLQQFLVDGSGNVQDPLAHPFLFDNTEEYPSHSVLFRQDIPYGGKDGGGFRRYTYATGAKPVASTIPGDPSESAPQSPELTYEAEYARSHVIHQPADSTTLTATSTNPTADDGNVEVTVESEGAGTSEVLTVGTAGSTSFSDIDAVYITSGEPTGDIQLEDDSSTNLLEKPLAGTDTNGIDYDKGVPLLGAGSHASAIGTDPEQYLGLNTTQSYDSGDLAQRVHSFDLSAEISTDRNAITGSRAQTIDDGIKTAQATADVAGPYESSKQMHNMLQGLDGDLVQTLGGTTQGSGAGDITLKNAQPTDVDEQSYGAGDANFIFGVTFTAQSLGNDGTDDGVTVTMTNTS